MNIEKSQKNVTPTKQKVCSIFKVEQERRNKNPTDKNLWLRTFYPVSGKKGKKEQEFHIRPEEKPKERHNRENKKKD